jgi:chromate transporter
MTRDRVPFSEAVRVWARIGLLSFGGPAGQVALMHRELVERRKWIDDERFLHALNYCMLLPGPEATQLATYIGWLMHRTRGGVVAGVLFVLPGFVSILALSALYAGFRELPAVAALFFGLKAAVLAVVVEAVVRIGKRALKNRFMVAVAALSFLALFLFDAPFPLVVFAAGLVGLVAQRLGPDAFPSPPASKPDAEHETVIDRMAAAGELAHTAPTIKRALGVLAVFLALWFGPIALLYAAFGAGSVFVREGIFFSKAAVVTFGGAYAVLGYVAQKAVDTFHWVRPGEMLDGLGLAETTPGPLIMVVQFVGFLGAHRSGELASPMLAGVLGSIVTVWVTFVPCFLWILLGAPYIEALRQNKVLRAALATITASIVGVILNLSLWFALHVLFHQLADHQVGPIHLLVPNVASFDAAAGALTLVAMLATFRFKLGLPKTLALSALLGMATKLLFL